MLASFYDAIGLKEELWLTSMCDFSTLAFYTTPLQYQTIYGHPLVTRAMHCTTVGLQSFLSVQLQAHCQDLQIAQAV